MAAVPVNIGAWGVLVGLMGQHGLTLTALETFPTGLIIFGMMLTFSAKKNVVIMYPSLRAFKGTTQHPQKVFRGGEKNEMGRARALNYFHEYGP